MNPRAPRALAALFAVACLAAPSLAADPVDKALIDQSAAPPASADLAAPAKAAAAAPAKAEAAAPAKAQAAAPSNATAPAAADKPAVADKPAAADPGKPALPDSADAAAPKGPATAPAASAPAAAPAQTAVAPAAPAAAAAVAPAAPAKEKPVEKAEAKEAPAPKPLGSCAASFASVADAYQKAHDDYLSWLREASDKMEALEAKISELKGGIQENSNQITKLQLDGTRDSDQQARDLKAKNKELWSELRSQVDLRQQTCRALSKEADRKARELNRSVLDAVDAARKAR